MVGADELAEDFVKLALALGLHDKDFVDAYLGPPEWAREAEAEQSSIDDLDARADRLIEALGVLERDGADPRESALSRFALAAKTRIQMLKGAKFSFNEEARRLYGVTPPDYHQAQFDAALGELESLAPGEGDLSARIDAFRNSLAIPADKREAVMAAAIAECRRRTLAHVKLPENERFTLEFVTDKPWGGYNWYQGDYSSLIEVNTDQPIIINRAVQLGCHEGYPGHHLWNVVVERDLRKAKGWIEFSVYPLFSPQGLVGEGAANYGVELAFSDEDRLKFEQETLYPLAGLDPAKAPKLAAINKASQKLATASVWIARDYLDGKATRDETIARLVKYEMISAERAAQRVSFFDTYRSYIINYSIGRDLVEAYMKRETASGKDPWEAFMALLENPDAVGALAPSK